MAGGAVGGQMAVDQGFAADGVAPVGQKFVRQARRRKLRRGLAAGLQVVLQGFDDGRVRRFTGDFEDIQFQAGVELAGGQTSHEILEQGPRGGLFATAQGGDDRLFLRRLGDFGSNDESGDFQGCDVVALEQLAQGFDAHFGGVAFAGGVTQGPRHGHVLFLESAQQSERLQAYAWRGLEVLGQSLQHRERQGGLVLDQQAQRRRPLFGALQFQEVVLLGPDQGGQSGDLTRRVLAGGTVYEVQYGRLIEHQEGVERF